MITVKSAKKTLTGNFEINGYCLMEDEKPTENIANGSKLWELNSGDKYVFDEENTEWIKLTTAHAQGGSVKTEVHTGTLDALFDVSNLKTYYDALNNGAVGIMTSENMPGVNMALNIVTNPNQNDSIIIVAGVGMQGLALREIYGLIEMDDNWPQNFETGSEFTDFILPHFADELGANVMIVVEGLSGSDPQIGFSGVYINTPASHGPLLYTLRESSLIQKLGSFTLTFYYMNNTQPTVPKEVLTGPLSTIFSDNGYTIEKFETLCNDIQTGKAAASMEIAMGNSHLLAFLMPGWTNGYSASVLFANLLVFNGTTLTNGSQIAWVASDDIIIQLKVWDSSGNEGAGAWTSIKPNNVDIFISDMLGIKSFTLTITRFNDI